MEDGNHLSRTGIQVHGRMTQLQNRNRNYIQRMRTTHGHWKVKQQFQRWKAEVLQLQQVWTYSKGMLEEEKERHEKILQIRKNGTYCKRL